MAKAGGKGRISNGLVAASCAAVMAVYAAGYWRTREEARRSDVRTQERRPPRPMAAPATSPVAVIEPPMASPVTAAEVPGTRPTAQVALAGTPTSEPPKRVAEALPPTVQSAAPSQAPIQASSPAATLAPPEASAAAATAALIPQPAPAPPAPSGNWRDGTYTGWGTSRHGDIKAQVVIRDGRIVEAAIASCETRYPCDVISDIIAQPVARQSPEVDRVSRATESADAYYYGLVEALKEAQVPDVGGASAPR